MGNFIKHLKRTFIIILLLPLILIFAYIFFEIFGMCVNHISTANQTNKLQNFLEDNITDIELLEIHSETGNTSGMGNHVDRLSEITFSTEMQIDEINDILSGIYDNDDFILNKDENGNYKLKLCTFAPFWDNIEGY